MDDDDLSDASLFDTAVPRAWAPLVAALGELEAALDGDPAARKARATDVRARLLADARALAGTTPAHLRASSQEYRLWFTEATLAWPHYAEAGGRLLVDEHESPTMARFRPDLQAGADEHAAIRRALATVFGWSAEDLEAFDGSVESRISNLRVKNAIAARLARELEGESLPERSLALFRRLYGPLPLRPGDVKVTLTTTTLILGLPFANGRLLAADFESRPADERAAIDAFLAQVEKHKNTFDTLRFPGFGLYDRALVDPALLAALEEAVAAAPGLGNTHGPVVAETLATMVTLVPSQEAELFLVHDIWGHGWEESLCDFEWSYARLIELRTPVRAAPSAFADPAAPPLRAAFTVRDGAVTLDRDLLRHAVEADLRGRITIGLNVVVSECLADLVEHKYNRRRAPGDPPLPSTSLFPEASMKLDLSLRDTQTLLKAAHRSYRRLLTEPAEAQRLLGELAASGLPATGLPEAVAEAVRFIGERFAGTFETRMTPPAAGSDARLPVNLAQRVMLGIVALEQALDRFLDEADAAAPQGPRWRSPAACIDLLLLLLGWFYEQDRALNFWHLDELLRQELGPTLAAFTHALAA